MYGAVVAPGSGALIYIRLVLRGLNLRTSLKVARILFEVLGGLAIILCVYLYYAFRDTVGMRNPCVYTETGKVASPDGKMIAEKQLQNCPYGIWVQVRLGMEGDESMEYEKIITLRKVDPSQIELLWTGTRELRVTFPKSALLLDAHSYDQGVTIKQTTRD